MFNFSANHLFLLSRTEYRSCAVFLMQDRDTQRVYRLYDFTKAQLISPSLDFHAPPLSVRAWQKNLRSGLFRIVGVRYIQYL